MDAGGYFPLDVNFIPDAEGKAEINVTIQYTDDFNSPREVTSKFFVDVGPAVDMSGPGLDGMGGGGGGGGGFVEPQPESTWQKVVRFIKGLFGLDSGAPVVPVDQSQPEVPPVHVNPAPMKGG